jgi:sterol 24-C-methyltransferase
MPFKNSEYDGAYAIEATCHAADKTKCFSEIFRVLKPGAYFTGYEWIITDKFDIGNEEHKRIRHGIELGNSLPTLETAAQVNAALAAAGFIVEESYDLIEFFENGAPKNIKWYAPLEASYTSPSGLKATPVGRWITSKMVSWMEFLRVAPKGSYDTAMILEEAAVNLVLGGKLQIFSPSYFFRARKPL